METYIDSPVKSGAQTFHEEPTRGTQLKFPAELSLHL